MSTSSPFTALPLTLNRLRQRSTPAYTAVLLGGMVLGCVLSLILALRLGSVPVSWSEVYAALRDWQQGAAPSLAGEVLSLRLARALSAFVTGASLALAGTMMQALLRNPLADPYVLGVSGGASVGALLVLLFVGAGIWVDAAAFAGAMLVAVLLYALAHRDLREMGQGEARGPLLLLTGVIVATGCGALVTLLLSIAPDGRLRSMVFWLIGDLSNTVPSPLPWLVWLGVGGWVLTQARNLNMLAMHADEAASLGVPVVRVRKGLFLGAALLTASAVSHAGSIGFVGLILPHACRFMLGPDHRRLLPVASVAGGCFLVCADTLARTVVAPQQLPVGVITAGVGVPLFLLQLHHLRRH